MFSSYIWNTLRLTIIHFSASDKWLLCLDTKSTDLKTENRKEPDPSGKRHGESKQLAKKG